LSLLVPDLQEWLPAGHLAHHVGELVDSRESDSVLGRRVAARASPFRRTGSRRGRWRCGRELSPSRRCSPAATR